MDQSHASKLTQESSKNLINYLKLLNELRDEKPKSPDAPETPEPENFDDLTDEELKNMALKAKHGAEND